MRRLALLGLLFLLATGPAASAAAVETIEGVSDTGARFSMSRPDAWNGELVLFAHGFVEPGAPIALPASALGVRGALLDAGYAVAYSSYAANGWAVEEGTRDTHDLRGRFQAAFGRPDRVYLVGHSMGALVSLALAQRHGQIYDGVLSLCGVLGGGAAILERGVHVRALFDYFFPGALPGSLTEPPTFLTQAQLTGLVAGAVLADPLRALELARVAQAELEFTDLTELITGLVTMIHAVTVETGDMVARTDGHWPVGNASTLYVGSSDDAALNAGIARVAASPSGANYLDRHYMPEGELGVPVVSLHNARDPFVPSTHQERFAAIVEDDAQVLYRQVASFGHCNFSLAGDVAPAFDALAGWVRTGERPGQ
jgi:pimeloyl-ACP methyl ester carboxylesterase